MSRMISSREKKIISFILESSTAVTLQDISNFIGLSRRTVLRNMKNVYNWFDEQGQPLNRVSNKGIFLECDENERLLLQNSLGVELVDHLYNRKERLIFILSELLQASSPLKIYYFAELLKVSDATISNDLNEAESWLKEFSLSLKRKQGYGLYIEGREKDFRKALISILYDSLNGEQIRDILTQYVSRLEDPSPKMSILRKKVLNLIDVETLKVIEESISTAEERLGFKFTEGSYSSLTIHFALAVKRLEMGGNVVVNPEVLVNLKNTEEYTLAKELLSDFEHKLNIQFPESEISYVTIHLRGAKYKEGVKTKDVLKINDEILGNYQISSTVNRVIAKASEISGYNLKSVDSLLIGLVDHLRPAINRLQMGLEIRNPLLEKIKSDYNDIFLIGKQCATIIEDDFGIQLPESEIGFIALHIGSTIEQLKNKSSVSNTRFNVVITCTTGIGTSKMLQERVISEFRNINIVDAFSTTELSNSWLRANEIDLIISSVYFENDVVPVVVVNPLLGAKDKKKIDNKLNKIYNNGFRKDQTSPVGTTDIKTNLKKIEKYSSAIIDLLDNFALYDDLDYTEFDDLLDHMCESIFHDDRAEEIKHRIIDREKYGSVFFEEQGILFLHTKSELLVNLNVLVFRNNNEIEYGKMKFQNVILMLAPKSAESEFIEIISQISKRLVSDDDFLDSIGTLTELEMYQSIEKYLKKFFYKKNMEIINNG